MDLIQRLDFWISMLVLGALAYYTISDWLFPFVRRSVKRSRRSYRSNAANAGSEHQNAGSGSVNVHANVQGSPAKDPPPALSPGEPESLTLSQREITQLAEAISARVNGATVEEALSQGFGVKKGSSAAYKRAKALFDAAMAPPA